MINNLLWKPRGVRNWTKITKSRPAAHQGKDASTILCSKLFLTVQSAPWYRRSQRLLLGGPSPNNFSWRLKSTNSNIYTLFSCVYWGPLAFILIVYAYFWQGQPLSGEGSKDLRGSGTPALPLLRLFSLGQFYFLSIFELRRMFVQQQLNKVLLASKVLRKKSLSCFNYTGWQKIDII